MADEKKGISQQQQTGAEKALHDETEVKQWETLNETTGTTQADPKSLLIDKAKELGINPDEYEFLTKAELQKLIDRRITEAIKTREENLKKKQQEEELRAKAQYEELLKMKEQELLNMKKKLLVTQAGLSEDVAELIDGNSEDEIQKKLEVLRKQINDAAQALLQDKLKGKLPTQPIKPEGTITKEMLKDMTPEQINKLWDEGRLKNLK